MGVQNNYDLRALVLEQIAYVEGRAVEDVEASIAAGGGDLELDSKLGQTVAVRVSVVLGAEELIRPEDQKRQNLTTVSALERLIEGRFAECRPEAGGS
jgi:hypothetical protein